MQDDTSNAGFLIAVMYSLLSTLRQTDRQTEPQNILFEGKQIHTKDPKLG